MPLNKGGYQTKGEVVFLSESDYDGYHPVI